MNKQIFVGIGCVIAGIVFIAPLSAAEDGEQARSTVIDGYSPAIAVQYAAADKDRSDKEAKREDDADDFEDEDTVPLPAESSKTTKGSAAAPSVNKVRTPVVAPSTKAATAKPERQNAPGRKQGNQAVLSSTEQKSRDDDKLAQREKKEMSKANKYLQDARQSYLQGDMEDAMEQLARCFALVPNNREAADLKTKISIIKERTEELKKDLAEQYYYRGEGFRREGDLLDAMLCINKSLALNGQLDKTQALSRTLSESFEEMVKKLRKSDMPRLLKVKKYFLNEDFDAAADVLRGLQAAYPELNTMLSVAEAHSSDTTNNIRSEEYFGTAMEDIANERFFKAQGSLYIALELNKDNLDARIKLIQVNHELGAQRIGAIGQ